MSQRALFYKHLYSYLPSCQLRPWGSSFLSQSGTRSQQNPPSPSIPCPGWDAIDLAGDTWLHTKLPEAPTESPNERAEQMAGVPLEVKVPGQGFKRQPRTWQSILCPTDKAVQFPREDSSGHPLWGQLCGGGHGSWQSLRLPGQPLTSESSSRPGSPQVLVRGLQQPQTTAPSPKCPATSELAILGTSWLQSLCRWEAERHWETPVLHPCFLLCQRLWTCFPNGGEAKLKSHHCSPSHPTPSPAFLGGETACIDLAPTQTSGETVPSDWGHSVPQTWPKLQDQASVQRSHGAEPALLQQVCLTLPAGMMNPRPGLHTAAV